MSSRVIVVTGASSLRAEMLHRVGLADLLEPAVLVKE
jgi:hypothetical protein